MWFGGNFSCTGMVVPVVGGGFSRFTDDQENRSIKDLILVVGFGR